MLILIRFLFIQKELIDNKSSHAGFDPPWELRTLSLKIVFIIPPSHHGRIKLAQCLILGLRVSALRFHPSFKVPKMHSDRWKLHNKYVIHLNTPVGYSLELLTLGIGNPWSRIQETSENWTSICFILKVPHHPKSGIQIFTGGFRSVVDCY